MIALIPVTPHPIAVGWGALSIHWYSVGYAAGLAVAYVVMTREAARRGLDPRVVDRTLGIVLVAGIVGARLYHVVHEWHVYAHDLTAIVLPPYTGLGVLGGIVAATLALAVALRRQRQDFWPWADVVAPGAFAVQAVARWGNFANQELYGPPTRLPWGIAIECRNRVEQYPCATYPEASTGFQPLFLYESVSAVLGLALLLWLGRRAAGRLRSGDLFLLWLLWYALVRIGLETLRSSPWVVGGAPTAMIVCVLFAAAALAGLALRHRPQSRSVSNR